MRRSGALKLPPQVFIILAMAFAAWLCIWLWQRDAKGDLTHLVASGTLEGKVVEAGSRIGGRLAEVRIQEGDQVEAGAVLGILEAGELSAQREQLKASLGQSAAQTEKLENGPRKVDLAQAAAGVEVARAQLAELEAGSRTEDIAAAQAAWDSAEAASRQAQSDLQRAEELFANGVIPKSQVEQARTASARAAQTAEAAKQQYEKAVAGPRETQIEAARAQVRAAQALYDQLAAGARSEDIAAANASSEAIEAQIRALDVRLAELAVLAPAKASVLTVNHEPGDLLLPSEAMCSLLIDGSLYVQVFVPEDKLSWAQPGAQAKVLVDSLPGQTLAGTVTYLAGQGEFTPRNLQTKEKRVEQVFRCKLTLDGAELRPGMACDVIFTQPGISSE